MTKYFKDIKGRFYVDDVKKTKAEFLRRMIKQERKQYIKESKFGNFYYSKILKSEMSFFLTTKVLITKTDEDFYMWTYTVKSKRRGKKPSKKTDFYAIKSKCNIVIYEDSQFLESGRINFNKFIKKLLNIVKNNYKIENVYCRAIINILFECAGEKKFELLFSTKGYVFEEKLQAVYKHGIHIFQEPLEKMYYDLIDKIFASQSITKYTFININLLCV